MQTVGHTFVHEHLVQFMDYLRNTGKEFLPVSVFDDDWEPIGSQVRKDLKFLGMTDEHYDMMSLTNVAHDILEARDGSPDRRRAVELLYKKDRVCVRTL